MHEGIKKRGAKIPSSQRIIYMLSRLCVRLMYRDWTEALATKKKREKKKGEGE
jgi:hypothetical protein